MLESGKNGIDTCQTSIPAYSPLGSTTFPDLSTCLLILNAARMCAIVSQSDRRTKYRPGQILKTVGQRYGHPMALVPDCTGQGTIKFRTHLLPKPNATVAGSMISGLSFPSLTKRSGRKRSGSGYTSESWRIALYIRSDFINRRTKGRAVRQENLPSVW